MSNPEQHNSPSGPPFENGSIFSEALEIINDPVAKDALVVIGSIGLAALGHFLYRSPEMEGIGKAAGLVLRDITSIYALARAGVLTARVINKLKPEERKLLGIPSDVCLDQPELALHGYTIEEREPVLAEEEIETPTLDKKTQTLDDLASCVCQFLETWEMPEGAKFPDRLSTFINSLTLFSLLLTPAQDSLARLASEGDIFTGEKSSNTVTVGEKVDDAVAKMAITRVVEKEPGKILEDLLLLTTEGSPLTEGQILDALQTLLKFLRGERVTEYSRLISDDLVRHPRGQDSLARTIVSLSDISSQDSLIQRMERGEINYPGGVKNFSQQVFEGILSISGQRLKPARLEDNLAAGLAVFYLDSWILLTRQQGLIDQNIMGKRRDPASIVMFKGLKAALTGFEVEEGLSGEGKRDEREKLTVWLKDLYSQVGKSKTADELLQRALALIRITDLEFMEGADWREWSRSIEEFKERALGIIFKEESGDEEMRNNRLRFLTKRLTLGRPTTVTPILFPPSVPA